MKKIAIIGCGAAGMMAAIAASGNGNEVTIFERNEKAGKKIYITGKGRCNVTNASDIDVIFNNIVTNRKFMYSSLYTFDNNMVMDFFEKAGIPLKVERGERVFPVSDRASDIIKGLTTTLREKNVKIMYNTRVKELIVEDNTVKGILLCDGTRFMCDRVIIATGGVSYKTTGSDGDGHRMAQVSGHRITELTPALVPLVTKEDYAKQMQGLSLKNVKVSIFQGGKKLYNDFGEMLFTHYGVSGPLILSASSIVGDKLKKGELKMTIDMKPALSEKQLDERILRDFEKNINKDFRNSLDELLPKKMIPVIIGISGISPYKKVNTITKEERNKLVNLIKAFELTLVSLRDFNEAIITKGGINVKDINPGTMESKIINDLYFAGEVIDVDALTGGFNLQVAWSTGYLAGMCAGE